MKKLLLSLLLTWGFIATNAQIVYNNEWIDYSKTYYKFKGYSPGVYRISQSVLSAAGLGSTPAEYFQLWRNGVQVPIYTSVSSGPLGTTDYIEFWNVFNDGKPDKELYRDPSFQLNNYKSLETDSSSYFLTVNPNSSRNLRLNNTPNNVAGNTLAAESYFMYKAVNYMPYRINQGYAVNVGEYLYSSSYDKGEGYASPDILTTSNGTESSFSYGTFSFAFLNAPNLYVSPSGPDAKLKISVSGSAVNPRSYRVAVNADTVINSDVNYFNSVTDSATIPLSVLASNKANVSVTNHTYCSPVSCATQDLMVVNFCEMTYPRLFNFDGLSSFEFTLPASGTGKFLKISNFARGSAIPVLYDLTNGSRYVADLSAAPDLQFVLQPSATERQLVLVSEDPSKVTNVSNLTQRNFINYATSANQGDYLIISNPLLYNGPGGSNPIDDYRAYRSSVAGGAYNAKVYDAEDLIDQFGFGIKKNPAGIRNFIRYARNNFATKPKQVFIIGKGISYLYVRAYETASDMYSLDLIPTFGFPASDVLLAAEPGSSIPQTPIGRLSAVNGQEVAVYLKKVKELEAAQAAQSPSTSDRAWMKNVVHIIGASEPGLEDQLTQYMDSYGKTIKDTLFGGQVTLFSKKTNNAVEQINNTTLQNLFSQGISLMTYFGHSSSAAFEFNLDNPENYNNVGKYPMFIALGCNAGNFFDYNSQRLYLKESLSETYVLSQDHGAIGFIASTYFGIPYYLDIWASRAYRQMADKSYGKTIGEIMMHTAADVYSYVNEDFYARCNTEQAELNGDPAIRLNPHAKPDYVIEDPMVSIAPAVVSTADPSFKVKAKVLNIGKAISKNIVLEVKRQYPDQSVVTVFRDTIPGIRFADSILINVPVVPSHDKGLNKVIITVDPDNEVDELYESNNSISKDIMIYDDEARPAYPYNYSIISHQNIKLIASTANPFAASKQYQMELDTTQLFNSQLKVTKTVTAAGGTIEFDPGISFHDSTVYYWRVAPVVTTGTQTWNMSSFVYLANSDGGFNQSHFFQHLGSNGERMSLDSASRMWRYRTISQNLFLKLGTYGVSPGSTGEASLSVSVNNVPMIRMTNFFSSLVFNVFDPVTFKPWQNQTVVSSSSSPDQMGKGLYGSLDNNAWFAPEPRYFNFEFRYVDPASRKRIMDFMKDVIPDGAYVVVRNFTLDPGWGFPSAYAADWKADETIYGAGQSVYQYLKNAGFSGVDSFYRTRPFGLVYKKNDPSFTPKWIVGDGELDNPTLSVDCPTPDTLGYITSPQFGPASKWKELNWNGRAMESSAGDDPTLDLIGIRTNGSADTLMRSLSLNQKVVDISSVNAKTYPYLQLRMRDIDTTNYTPYQIRYWRLTGTPAPEGAVAPNTYFSMKDTLDVAEPMDFKFAFKNISETPFNDSLKVRLTVTDHNNIQHIFPTWKQKPLVANDTLMIHYPADTRQLVGANSIYIEVNPDNDQPEIYHFNNFIYKNLYVRADTIHPLMDVTFDNVHILNNDIVSAKPNVLIKLKDESKWFLLDNYSAISVKVKFPDGSSHPYNFNSDTLQFIAAQKSANNDNTASAVFKPYFPTDGNYELIVTGKDMSQNSAGKMEYRVGFQVINKPMISNMLNYPNPFTTSTAFVFTVTGSEVPQNIRIQILTVTGKVIREITKEELGPIHIGRNITEFKWDGTDQYGQKVGNGVYLYRVITNLNGKALDKYTSDSDNTDKYFNKGYGKMYLMR